MILSKEATQNTKPNSKFSDFKSLLVVVALALLIRIFIIELFFVPTSSMQATILTGEYVFATKYSYGFSKYSIPFNPNIFSGRILAKEPDRGDIIIMRPPHDMTTRYVKRLIGLPGDKIEVINDVIHINDNPIKRVEVGSYSSEDGFEYIKFRETLPNGLSYFSYKLKHLDISLGKDHSNSGPYIVPNNNYFFMGDNRDESGDSRYQLGPVPFDNLIAKAQFVFFSTGEILWDTKLGVVDQLQRVGTWLMSIRFNRLFTTLYSSDDNHE